MEKKLLWDIAVEESNKLDEESNDNNDPVLLLVGSKKGGKSTIIYKFLDRVETPKTGMALEYLFGRRNKGIESGKEICHIYELGGGTLFMDLLEIAISSQNVKNISIAIFLDLSKTDELWFTMEALLINVKKYINQALSKDPVLKKKLLEESKGRIPKDHEDYDSVNIFPVPLLIIGTKYDIFQSEDFEKRKILCKCLRYVAHYYGASLQFVSSKSETLITKTRASISHMVFGTAYSKNTVLDHNKPLYICAGADSFQSIESRAGVINQLIMRLLTIGIVGSLTSLNVGNESVPKSIETVKKIFCSHFPQMESRNILPDDPAADPNFKEPDIDNMLTQKRMELHEYLKKKEEKKFDWKNC